MNNEKWFSGLNDMVFKTILTNKKNNPLLKQFLEKALNMKIDNIKVLSQDIPKGNVSEKGKIADILVDTGDVICNIEVNTSYYTALHRRNLTYITSKYNEEVKASKNYTKMSLFIQINLTKGLGDTRDSLEEYRIVSKNNHLFVDNLIILEFNIDKIMKDWYNGDRSFGFIAVFAASKEELDSMKGDEFMEKVKDEITTLNKDRRFTQFLSEEEDREILNNSLYSEGEEAGFMKGEEVGEKRGLEIGEKEKSIEIAKNMLNMNLDIETISKATGLSEKKISNLM